MRKLAAVALIGLTALGGVAATSQEAEARSRHGAAVAAGIIGLAAGAIIASSAANAYGHSGYGYAHPGYGYAPVGYGYAHPGYAYDYGYQNDYAPVASYGYAAPVYYAQPRVIVRHRHVAPRYVVRHRHVAPRYVVPRRVARGGRHIVVRHGYPVRARAVHHRRAW